MLCKRKKTSERCNGRVYNDQDIFFFFFYLVDVKKERGHIMDLPMHCFLIQPITCMWSQHLQPIPTSSVHSEASLGSHPY